MCKLMEKIINYGLRWFLEMKQLISKFQSGFRQSYSTYDDLINLESNICEAFANKQHVIAVCLDIENVYDMVWRSRILKVLQNLNFISNFLSTRVIEVRVNTFSPPKILENGVSQGSVLSVSIFLIAINDIFVFITNSVMGLLFADDLTLVCKGKNPHTTQILL